MVSFWNDFRSGCPIFLRYKAGDFFTDVAAYTLLTFVFMVGCPLIAWVITPFSIPWWFPVIDASFFLAIFVYAGLAFVYHTMALGRKAAKRHSDAEHPQDGSERTGQERVIRKGGCSMTKLQRVVKLPIHITVDVVPDGVEKEAIIDQMRTMAWMLDRCIDLHIVGMPPTIILLGCKLETENEHA